MVVRGMYCKSRYIYISIGYKMKESALADSFQYLQNCADLFCEQGEASSGLCPNVGRSLPVSVSGTISARRKFCPNVDCSLLVNPDWSSIKKRRPAAPSPTKNQLPQSLMTDLGLTKTNIYYEECGLRVYLRYVTEFESRKTVQTESRTKPARFEFAFQRTQATSQHSQNEFCLCLRLALLLAEVQPVFGETKETQQIAHYDTSPVACLFQCPDQ